MALNPRLKRRGIILLVLLVCALLVWWQCEALLVLPARFLVKTDPLEKADVAIVLAGGVGGDRIVRAGELVRQGLAPVALVRIERGTAARGGPRSSRPAAHGRPRYVARLTSRRCS